MRRSTSPSPAFRGYRRWMRPERRSSPPGDPRPTRTVRPLSPACSWCRGSSSVSASNGSWCIPGRSSTAGAPSRQSAGLTAVIERTDEGLAFRGELLVGPEAPALPFNGDVQNPMSDEWRIYVKLRGDRVSMEGVRFLAGVLEPGPTVRATLRRISSEGAVPALGTRRAGWHRIGDPGLHLLRTRERRRSRVESRGPALRRKCGPGPGRLDGQGRARLVPVAGRRGRRAEPVRHPLVDRGPGVPAMVRPPRPGAAPRSARPQRPPGGPRASPGARTAPSGGEDRRAGRLRGPRRERRGLVLAERGGVGVRSDGGTVAHIGDGRPGRVRRRRVAGALRERPPARRHPLVPERAL